MQLRLLNVCVVGCFKVSAGPTSPAISPPFTSTMTTRDGSPQRQHLCHAPPPARNTVLPYLPCYPVL